MWVAINLEAFAIAEMGLVIRFRPTTGDCVDRRRFELGFVGDGDPSCHVTTALA